MLVRRLLVDAKKHDIKHDKLILYFEEYKLLYEQIVRRVDMQQKLFNYQLIAAGIVATIAIRFIQIDITGIRGYISARYFLLLSPLVFIFFSWAYSNHDIMILALARYINKEVRMRIKSLLDGEDMLCCEDFLQKDRRMRGKNYGLIPIFGGEYLFPIVLPIILLIVYAIIFLYPDLVEILELKNIYYLQLIIFIIDIILIAMTIKLKIRVGKGYLKIMD